MKPERLSYVLGIVAVLVAVLGLFATVLDVKGLPLDNPTIYLSAIAASAYAAIASVYLARLKERRLRQKRVFIIYSHADVEAARFLAARLKESGFHPWFDQDEILPGQKVNDSILNGLIGSSVALLLVSSNLKVEGTMTQIELDVALKNLRTKDPSFSPVIPVRLDETPVPSDLAGVNWVQFEKPDDFERLNAALKRIVDA